MKKAVLEEEKGIRIASKSCEDEPPWMESVLPKQSLFEKIIERLAAAEESKRNEDSLSNGKEADSFTPNNKVSSSFCMESFGCVLHI